MSGSPFFKFLLNASIRFAECVFHPGSGTVAVEPEVGPDPDLRPAVRIAVMRS